MEGEVAHGICLRFTAFNLVCLQSGFIKDELTDHTRFEKTKVIINLINKHCLLMRGVHAVYIFVFCIVGCWRAEVCYLDGRGPK